MRKNPLLKLLSKLFVSVVLGLAVLLNNSYVVFADEISDLEEQLAAIQAQAAEEQRKSEEVDAKIVTVSEQLRAMQNDIESAEKSFNEVNNMLIEIESAIAANDELMTRIEADLSDKNAVLERRIRDIYINGQISYLDVFFGAKDYHDLMTRIDLWKQIMKHDYDLIKTVIAKHEQAQKVKAQLEVERKQQKILVDAAQVQYERWSEKQDKYQQMLYKLENDRDTYIQAYEELILASREVESLIQRSRHQYSGGAVTGSGKMIWPLEGPITSEYGWREHPITGDSRYHSGLDIGGDYDLEIVAADSGTVIYSGWISGYGYTIIIDHGRGLSTLYAHNESLIASEGQTVMQGQPIAYCGSTGNSTGPHCHFEVRMDGSTIDPMGFLY